MSERPITYCNECGCPSYLQPDTVFCDRCGLAFAAYGPQRVKGDGSGVLSYSLGALAVASQQSSYAQMMGDLAQPSLLGSIGMGFLHGAAMSMAPRRRW